MNLTIIGSGHVGLITGVCFAELGNQVVCVDNDERKINMLKEGILPIYEPQLEEMFNKNRNKLSFTTSIKEGIKDAKIIFICVGTPPKPSGDADLSIIEKVTNEIAENMSDYKLIVEKSTVPVCTGIKIKEVMKSKSKADFDVASNPEFLREGSAIHDFMHPDRIVIGVESDKAKTLLLELYEPIKAPILITDIESAELIKHASNSFLAMKISFINQLAKICEKVGADINEVSKGMGLDHRIGEEFLNAGIGFGGFCFPKDLRAFMRIAEKLGVEFNLLKEVEKINQSMRNLFINKIEEALWNLKDKVIGILGLSFKPNTEDMRFAPSIDIIKKLQNEGAKIKAYDPKSIEEAKKIFGNKKIIYCANPYEVAKDADCLCIITEWDEFKNLDLRRIKSLLKLPIIIDGRNIFNKKYMEELGFIYKSIGR